MDSWSHDTAHLLLLATPQAWNHDTAHLHYLGVMPIFEVLMPVTINDLMSHGDPESQAAKSHAFIMPTWQEGPKAICHAVVVLRKGTMARHTQIMSAQGSLGEKGRPPIPLQGRFKKLLSLKIQVTHVEARCRIFRSSPILGGIAQTWSFNQIRSSFYNNPAIFLGVILGDSASRRSSK